MKKIVLPVALNLLKKYNGSVFWDSIKIYEILSKFMSFYQKFWDSNISYKRIYQIFSKSEKRIRRENL